MEFSFFSMISQASLVAKIVLCILVLMSVGSWGMMIQKTLALNAAYRKALQGTDLFEKAPSLREAVLSLGSDRASPLYFVAHQGVMEFNRSKEAGNSSEIVVDNVRRSLRQGVASGPLHRPVRYGVGHHALLPLHRHAQVRLPGHGGPRHLRSPGGHGHRSGRGRARHHRFQHLHGQARRCSQRRRQLGSQELAVAL